MASLTGTKIKNTYDGLLKTTDNEPLDGTPRVITDGLGNNSALSLSTSAANVGGTLGVSGNATFDTNISVGGIIRNVNDLDTSISFGTNQVSLITGGLTRLSASDASVQVTNALVASSTLSVTGNYNSTNGDISLANGKIVVGGSVSIANSVGAASFSPNANLLVIGDTGAAANQGMTIVSPIGATGNIYFADGTTGTERYRGSVTYNHNEEKMFLGVNATNIVSIDSISANVTGNFNATGSITGGNINASSLAVSGNAAFDTNTLFVDAANNRVGVGTASPATNLEVVGLTTLTRSSKSVLINPNFGAANLYSQIDTDSGMGLAFAPNGGTEAMRIASSGDISFRDSSANEAFYWDASAASLGIGGVPSYALDVNVSTDADWAARIKNTSSTGYGLFVEGSENAGEYILGLYNGNSYQMVVEGNGNVGIGTSSLNLGGWSKALCINGAASEALELHTNGTHFLSLAAGGSSTLLYAVANVPLIFGTNNTERMRIDSSGNVGIGTATIGEKLSLKLSNIAGLQNMIGIQNATSTGTLASFGLNLSTDELILGTDYGASFVLKTSGTERMRITSGGDVTVGDESASAKLWVKNSGSGNSFGVRNTNASYVATVAFIGADRNTTDNSFYYIDCYNYGSSSYRLRVADSGNVTNTNNSYGAISDIKLKENIVDATPKLDKLMNVRVVNYNLIGDDKKQLGVVAQELEEVFPSMIDESPDYEEREVEVRDEEGNIVYKTEQVLVSEAVLDEEGNVVEEAVYETIVTDEPEMTKEKFDLGTVTKSVKYSVFVPMLIKAMQEQQEIINDLKARIEQLEA